MIVWAQHQLPCRHTTISWIRAAMKIFVAIVQIITCRTLFQRSDGGRSTMVINHTDTTAWISGPSRLSKCAALYAWEECANNPSDFQCTRLWHSRDLAVSSFQVALTFRWNSLGRIPSPLGNHTRLRREPSYFQGKLRSILGLEAERCGRTLPHQWPEGISLVHSRRIILILATEWNCRTRRSSSTKAKAAPWMPTDLWTLNV